MAYKEFGFTGTQVSWTEPTGSSQTITIEATGAEGGGGGGTDFGGSGGAGGGSGHAEVEVAVSGGETFNITVADGGGLGEDDGSNDPAGGSGGASPGSDAGGAGGGGAFDGGAGGGGGGETVVGGYVTIGGGGGGGGGYDGDAGGGGGGGGSDGNGGDPNGSDGEGLDSTGGHGGNGGDSSFMEGGDGQGGNVSIGSVDNIIQNQDGSLGGGGNPSAEAGDAGFVRLEYATPPSEEPANLTATVVDDTTIDLTWDDADNEDHYVLQVSEDGSGYSTVDGNIAQDSTSYTYNATASVNTHQFRAKAVTADGQHSDWVTSNSVDTDASGLSVTGHGADSVSLSWTQPSSADGAHVWRAEASQSKDTANYTQVADLASGTDSHTDSGLENGERYFYRVTAYYSGSDTDPTNEVDQTTDLPAPVLDSLNASVEDEVTVAWTLNDNSSDGDVEVLRSTDGSTGSVVATITDLSQTTYTDTGLSEGTEYHYTIRRNTDHASADSGQQAATTILPAPINVDVPSETDTTIDIEWALESTDEDGVRVLLSRDDGQTWSQNGSDLPAGTESYTATGLLNGEEYRVDVEVFTDDATSSYEDRL